MFFTRVFFLANVLVPLVKLTLTIIGSIVGVIPTATDNANRIASNTSLRISAYIINTAIETTSIYLIRSFVILFIPFSKFVISFLLSICLPIFPKYVENPMLITIPVALPLITLVPIKQILDSEKISFDGM